MHATTSVAAGIKGASKAMGAMNKVKNLIIAHDTFEEILPIVDSILK